MNSHQTEQSTVGRSAAGYTYPIRAFTAILLWAGEIFAGFRYTKTSANKRFYNMSSYFTSVSDGMLVLLFYLIYNRLCRNTHQTNR